jgi:hypothetical protein
MSADMPSFLDAHPERVRGTKTSANQMKVRLRRLRTIVVILSSSACDEHEPDWKITPQAFTVIVSKNSDGQLEITVQV